MCVIFRFGFKDVLILSLDAVWLIFIIQQLASRRGVIFGRHDLLLVPVVSGQGSDVIGDLWSVFSDQCDSCVTSVTLCIKRVTEEVGLLTILNMSKYPSSLSY